jgi:hypothetical protein
MQREVTLAAKSAEPDVDQDKAWLGVVLQASDEPGALIELLHPRGPAKQAGLRRGDVIVQIEGEKVTSVEEAVAQIERHKPQATVNLVVLREGKEETIKVTLGRASEALIGLPPLALVPFGWTDGLAGLPPGEQDQIGDDYAQLKDLVRQLRKEVSELRQELRGRPGNGASEERGDYKESTKPEGTESRNPAKPDSPDDPDAASAADNSSPAAFSPPSRDYLAQYRPYYRYAGRRYRYWYPAPRPYRYSYYYHHGAPYYYAYPQTNAYPNAGPYYYGPGVTVRVGPRVYFRYWR